MVKEQFKAEYGDYLIEAVIGTDKGMKVPLSYRVFHAGRPINHILSDKFRDKIEKILYKWCREQNVRLT